MDTHDLSRLLELSGIISERRTNPTLNIKDDVQDKLVQYSNDSSMCVTFSTVNKVGVNPQSNWTTPNGVYAYPLHMFTNELSNNYKLDTIFPYATDRRYVFVLKDVSSNQLVFKAGETLGYTDKLKLVNEANNILSSINSDGKAWAKAAAIKFIEGDHAQMLGHDRALYIMIRDHILKELDGIGGNRTNVFNYCLRNLGYDSIVDFNTGTMHSNEPTQICFLTPKAYSVQELLLKFKD